MTGPRFDERRKGFLNKIENPSANIALRADERDKEKDNDSTPKDSHEPANRRGSGVEREYPQSDAEGDGRGNESVESEDKRGAA